MTAGTGVLKRDGRLLVTGRGLVLADQPSVPAALRGTNPFPDFRAIVSCQSIGADGSAAITNISTDNFSAAAAGNSNINAMGSLPHPCIAPTFFVTGPARAGAWLPTPGDW